jgi:uncharacterized phage infection (PIP) family protein YhgE
MSWKNDDDMSSMLFPRSKDPIKNNYYMEITSELDQESLNITYEKIKQLEEDIGSVEAKREDLNKKKEDLEKRQKELEQAIASFQSQEASYASGINQIKPKISRTHWNWSFLSQEQKAILDIEQGLIGGGGSTGTKPLQSGEYYFSGRGRDLLSRAWVGMSQWGAYGLLIKDGRQIRY